MNSKIKVDKFVIVVFLLCMVCNMTMQAKAYESFKVSIYVRAYEVDKMKDIHWLDSTWTVISQQLEVDKISGNTPGLAGRGGCHSGTGKEILS